MSRDRSDEHGITPREQEIMDLFEGGMPKHRISRALRVSPSTVHNVVGRYHYPVLAREMSRTEAATRAADRAYQRALAASGGRFA